MSHAKILVVRSNSCPIPTNTLGKGMNLFIIPAMGSIVPWLFLCKDGFKITHEVWYVIKQRNQAKSNQNIVKISTHSCKNLKNKKRKNEDMAKKENAFLGKQKLRGNKVKV